TNDGYDGKLRNTFTLPTFKSLEITVQESKYSDPYYYFKVNLDNTPCRYESAYLCVLVEVPRYLFNLMERMPEHSYLNIESTGKHEAPLQTPPAPADRPDSYPIVDVTHFSYDMALVQGFNGAVDQYGNSVGYRQRYSSFDLLYSGIRTYHYDYNYKEYGLSSYCEIESSFYPEWFDGDWMVIKGYYEGKAIATGTLEQIAVIDGELHLYFEPNKDIEDRPPMEIWESHFWIRVPMSVYDQINHTPIRNFEIHMEAMGRDTHIGSGKALNRPSNSREDRTVVEVSPKGMLSIPVKDILTTQNEAGETRYHVVTQIGNHEWILRDFTEISEEMRGAEYWGITLREDLAVPMEADLLSTSWGGATAEYTLFLLGKVTAADITDAVVWDRETTTSDFELVPVDKEGEQEKTVRYLPTRASGSITVTLVEKAYSWMIGQKDPPDTFIFRDGENVLYDLNINSRIPPTLEIGKTYVLTHTDDTVVYAPEELIGRELNLDQMKPYLNAPTISIREATEAEAEQMACTLNLKRA
ncbi:MAG: hypothetical protein IJD10_00570, partial [Clostridia bacterium]|nr:hypothetical protein [Clostridia bacterium]